jgi:hypothetical protein
MLTAAAAREVGVFVDWNSRLKLAPTELEDLPSERAQFALRQLGKGVARFLCSLDRSSIFRVRLRLYHGWTAGTTPSPNRRAVFSLAEFYDPEALFPSPRVLSPSPIELGDRLMDARDERLVTRLNIHLPNTLRRQRGDEPPVEKMVDAALASDLLSWARREPASLALVLSSDDDIIPPVFVAEAWMAPFGGEVRILRPEARGDSRFLHLEGLLA